jgi:uncharacterized protein YijF (DUF1287 family)
VDNNTKKIKVDPYVLHNNLWGLNTHVGIVGSIKDGVPLIFHNITGTVRAEPASKLRIMWVKGKGDSPKVKV